MLKQQYLSQNLSNEENSVLYEDRIVKNGHKGAVLWFTGLSAAGKTTLAQKLQKELFAQNRQVYVLDGDNVRKGLNGDLAFSEEDRSENIRRIAQVAKLFADAGFVVVTSFISPYEKDRLVAKEIIGNLLKIIHIKAGIEECKRRDPKGLYEKAMAGEIKNFTGIDDIYEEPKNADLVVDTKDNSVKESMEILLKFSTDLIEL